MIAIVLPFVVCVVPPSVAKTLTNAEAVIPPQCYTKTEGTFNPCYVCHQTHPEGSRNNFLDDGNLQGAYEFSDLGTTNQWQNLFAVRSNEVSLISDEAILNYVREDNYQALYHRHRNSLESRDVYLADLTNLGLGAEAFDEQGFAKDGSGWVAFNYKPFPSTFWPTNGSADDVMIRLPEDFRKDREGRESRAIYLINLSLVEMAIKDLDQLDIPPADERLVGYDLDGDGVLGLAQRLVRRTYYLGGAEQVYLVRQQYPVGTEFLHSIRYLDINERGEVVAAVRLKELRYSKKYKLLNDNALRFMYNLEKREKDQGRLPNYAWAKPAGKAGLNNKMGWYIQGWIEDKQGHLRRADYEENFFCMGCHTTVGTTIDQTFAFPRKVTGAAGWGYINLKGMPDAPSRGELQGEILTYLERVGGGDEFRQNQEMIQRWFTSSGVVEHEKVQQADVYQLITPSAERALELNKAYRLVVEEQSFHLGRDAVLSHPHNVFQQIDPASAPVLPADKHYRYDLRLDWSIQK